MILVAVIIVACVIVGYFIFNKKSQQTVQQPVPFSTSNQTVTHPATTVPTSTETIVSTTTSTTTQSQDPNTKKYYSKNLGISFDYVSRSDFSIAIKEISNKIYVYLADEDYNLGQSVEVFSKDPKLTLKEAIEKKFLVGYNPKTCFVKDHEEYYQLNDKTETAVIGYPASDNPNDPFWQNMDKCPYPQDNGVDYFFMHKDSPEKFFYLQLGQAILTTDGTIENGKQMLSWSNSIKVVK
jgi:hypothetical protein